MTGAEPSFAESLIDVVTLQAGYNTIVVTLGATLLGIASGAVGVFAMLRRQALVSDAMAHATLPGVAMAFLLATRFGADGRSLPLLLAGAAATGVLGALTIKAILRASRLREDAAIGAVLSVFFGVGIVLLSVIQNSAEGNAAGLNHLIYGQTAALQERDAWLIGALALASLLGAGLLLKEFRVVCFDDRFAAAIGLPVGVIDIAMMALIVIVVVIGLQAVGLLLIVALLIIPPAAARFWTERLGLMLIIATAIGGASGLLGAVKSSTDGNLPAGAVIVLTAAGFFAISMALAPRRGAFAHLLRLLRLRVRVAVDHLLRSAYERLEAGSEPIKAGAEVRIADLRIARSWSKVGGLAVCALARASGLVKIRDGALTLTERGAASAIRLTRNHRMWEEYLSAYADVAASHVDWSADRVEHILSPGIIDRLEVALRKRDRLPEGVPPSVHTIGGGS
ncbi:MAG: metal ABC transporter permease [Phycisphaerales bacterium JB039]